MIPLKPLILSLGFALSVFPLTGCAAEAKSEASAQVRQLMIQKFPDRQIGEVRPTPVAGVYEVVLAGRQIVYVDEKVEHLFDGELIDLKTRQSLTEARTASLMTTSFSNLPLSFAIKTVKGKGTRQVVVFSDPDCPYCKRLEKEVLAKMKDLTIYTFLLPLESLHPKAKAKSAKVWCSANRQAAWDALMLKNKEPAGTGACQTPLQDIAGIAEKLGIRGTPTLILSNGRILPGMPPSAEALDQLLNAAESK